MRTPEPRGRKLERFLELQPVVRLVPTDRGRALARQCRAARRQSASSLFDGLRDEQVDAPLDVMETLATEMLRGASTAAEAFALELAR